MCGPLGVGVIAPLLLEGLGGLVSSNDLLVSVRCAIVDCVSSEAGSVLVVMCSCIGRGGVAEVQVVGMVCTITGCLVMCLARHRYRLALGYRVGGAGRFQCRGVFQHGVEPVQVLSVVGV